MWNNYLFGDGVVIWNIGFVIFKNFLFEWILICWVVCVCYDKYSVIIMIVFCFILF